MKTTKIVTIAAAAGAISLYSCTKNDGPGPGGGTGDNIATVRINNLPFTGNSLGLDGENDITDMQACLFENGIMTGVFEGLAGTGPEYRLQLDRHEGRLYMLANLSGTIDLNGMLSSGISEEDFMRTAVGMGRDGKIVNFFTGLLELSGQETYSHTVNMERGVARFDLYVTSVGQPVSVKRIEVTDVAQKGFLLTPSSGISTPEASGTASAQVEFDVPVTDRYPGFLYVYEQKNSGMQVLVTIESAGEERVLAKEIEGDISRNAVYSIKVNKDKIDINVSIGISDWEDGTDTEIEV